MGLIIYNYLKVEKLSIQTFILIPKIIQTIRIIFASLFAGEIDAKGRASGVKFFGMASARRGHRGFTAAWIRPLSAFFK